MAKVKDIEYVRERADISYRQAAALINENEGDIDKVMAQLEKDGLLKSPASEPQAAEHQPEVQPEVASEQSSKVPWSETLGSWIITLIKYRLVVKSGDMIIANLSILFMLVALICAPYLLVLSAILMLVFRYTPSVTSEIPRGRADAIRNFFDSLNPGLHKASEAPPTKEEILGEDEKKEV